MLTAPQKFSLSPGLLDHLKKDADLFNPDQPTDPSWNVDFIETNLGMDPSGELFKRAVGLIMQYQLYPARIMTFYSPFVAESRHLRAGDYILQNTTVFPGLLTAWTLSQVTALIVEPARYGFTYFTTSRHFIEGEFSIQVVTKGDQSVRMMAQSISRPCPRFNPLMRWAIRRAQVRAHKSIIPYLQERLKSTERAI